MGAVACRKNLMLVNNLVNYQRTMTSDFSLGQSSLPSEAKSQLGHSLSTPPAVSHAEFREAQEPCHTTGSRPILESQCFLSFFKP